MLDPNAAPQDFSAVNALKGLFLVFGIVYSLIVSKRRWITLLYMVCVFVAFMGSGIIWAYFKPPDAVLAGTLAGNFGYIAFYLN